MLLHKSRNSITMFVPGRNSSPLQERAESRDYFENSTQHDAVLPLLA